MHNGAGGGEPVVVPHVKWSKAQLTTERTENGFRITFTVPWEPRIAIVKVRGNP